MERVYSNLFYFRKLSRIGGTEQFLWEIAKKYHKYDIAMIFDVADSNQIQRLRTLVRCIIRKPNQKYKCKKLFLNFNAEILDSIDFEYEDLIDISFVSHANFEEIGYKPPIDDKRITSYIGVSKFAANKLDEYGAKIGESIKSKYTYNPLTLEPKEKVLIIVSAGRLDDKVKGGERTVELINALDKYCELNNRHYLWLIFTNPTGKHLFTNNAVYMNPRLDVRPYISMANWYVQLSNDMETYCYSINEALGYGVPIVTTPLSIVKELPITDNMRLECKWDMSNADEIAKLMFEKEIKKFNYNIPEDNWEDYLIKDLSKYEEEKKMKVKVRCIHTYIDNELSAKAGKNVYVTIDPEDPNYERIVTRERAEVLESKNLVKIIEEVEEPKIENATVDETKKESATIKTKATKKKR